MKTFDLCITAINLVLSIVNLWILYKLRPYSRKQLDRYSRQWISNLNYEQVRKVVDEANKTKPGE